MVSPYELNFCFWIFRIQTTFYCFRTLIVGYKQKQRSNTTLTVHTRNREQTTPNTERRQRHLTDKHLTTHEGRCAHEHPLIPFERDAQQKDFLSRQKDERHWNGLTFVMTTRPNDSTNIHVRSQDEQDNPINPLLASQVRKGKPHFPIERIIQFPLPKAAEGYSAWCASESSSVAFARRKIVNNFPGAGARESDFSFGGGK